VVPEVGKRLDWFGDCEGDKRPLCDGFCASMQSFLGGCDDEESTGDAEENSWRRFCGTWEEDEAMGTGDR
jgi:hypothetical protein